MNAQPNGGRGSIALLGARATPSPAHLTIAIAASVFSAELIVMLVLLWWRPGGAWINSLMDTGMTTLMIIPALYFWAFRPLTHHIAELRRAEHDLLGSQEQLRALAARLQAVREEERARVAREIHDVLAQELTRLKMDVTWVNRHLTDSVTAGEQQLLHQKLTGMSCLTDTAIQTVQRIAAELRPAVLDSLGLCAAIEWQASDFQGRTGIACRAAVPPAGIEVNRDAATALFRIVQESLTNVLRHAAATEVQIRLETGADDLLLTVQDNGSGVPPAALDDPASVGLVGMRERALLLGGRCDIMGHAGRGTTVVVRLPLPQPNVHHNAR